MTPEHYKVQTGDLAYSIIAGNIAPQLSTVERRTFGNKIGAANGLRSLKVGEIIHYDPADIPAPPPPVVEPPVVLPPIIPPYMGSKVPPLSTCGPQVGNLTNTTWTSIGPGTYEAMRFTQQMRWNPGRYILNDVDLSNSRMVGGDNIPKGVVIIATRCKLPGVYGNYGELDLWEYRKSIAAATNGQALRPMGAGSIYLEDSWFLTQMTQLIPGQHVEACQTLGGADVVSVRCGWSCNPIGTTGQNSTTTVTGVVNWGAGGSKSTSTDDTFGYWNGTAWTAGGGNHCIYPGLTKFVRPEVHHPSPFGSPPVSLVDPVYL